MKIHNNKESMIREVREVYGLSSPGVFFALKKVPREKFVLKKYRESSYADCALPIGYGQTISQPYTVAFMTHLIISSLNKNKRNKVLEVGTGSGYQAAVLSYLFKKVYTTERIQPLFKKAKIRLKRLGFKNIFLKLTKDNLGWKEKSPYDAIIITAGVEKIPKALFEELKPQGVLVVLEGKGFDKEMVRYKKGKKLEKQAFGIFNFVPLVLTN